MTGRVQECSREQARTRLDQGRAYLEIAQMVAEDDADDSLRGVAAGLAVLAGIAAADAASCHALGHRSRSTNHRDAIKVVAGIGGDDAKAASNALRRPIDLKDQAHYGFTSVSAADRATALKAAERLVAFAEATSLRER